MFSDFGPGAAPMFAPEIFIFALKAKLQQFHNTMIYCGIPMKTR